MVEGGHNRTTIERETCSRKDSAESRSVDTHEGVFEAHPELSRAFFLGDTIFEATVPRQVIYKTTERVTQSNTRYSTEI
jgi:hypothetical protein